MLLYLTASTPRIPKMWTEVQLGAWFVFPADTAIVFDSDSDSLGQQMIQKTELRFAQTEPSTEIPPSVELF